jgi:hypothetical protein
LFPNVLVFLSVFVCLTSSRNWVFGILANLWAFIGVTHSLDWVLFVCNPRISTHIFVASGAERVSLDLWFSCASVSPFVSSVSFFFFPPSCCLD